jgi:predicted ATP-grasp superfamily ATP-dependent carboligase
MNTNPEHGTRNPEPKRRHVLIVGVSTRAAAESAGRAGFEVTALDAYADRDQHPSVRALSLPRDFGTPFSPEALVNAARELPGDAVVYLSSLENHPKAVDALTSGRALWGNRSDVLRRVRDPKALSGAFTSHGLPAPRVVSFNEAASLPSDVDRWMLKPRVSGGGHGVRRWHPGDTVTAGHYLQELIDGTSGSIVFVAAGGRGVVAGITRQMVGDEAFGASGYRYCGNILTDDRRHVRRAAALVDVVASEFDLVGVGSIDVVAAQDGLRPVEVNPRWSASMELVERARDMSMFQLHADASTKGTLPAFDLGAASGHGETHGKAIVFARQDVVIGDTRRWLEDRTVRDVPHAGEHIAAGQPICTVLAVAHDEAGCYARLVDRAARVYADCS